MANTTTQTPEAQPTKRRRWWPKLLVGFLVLALLAVWFAPAVIARTSLRNRFVQSATGELRGTVNVSGASLGWFSSVELRDVTLTDEHGRVVASIPKVTTEHTLLALVWDSGNVGRITIERPTVEIVCRHDGSNLEDVLQNYLTDTSPPNPTRTPLSLRVNEGTLTLRDAEHGGAASEFANISAAVTVPAPRSEPIAVNVTADAPSHIEAEVSLGEANRVKLKADNFTLQSLAPLLRRVDPELTLGGTLTTDVAIEWSESTTTIDGTIRVKQLAATTPALHGDTLRLTSAELPIKASITGSRVSVERAELTTGIGSASVAGTFDTSESFDAFLQRPGTQIIADVDLAKLAAVFPQSLHVRDGTEIQAGNVELKLVSTADTNGTAWTGNVKTSALVAKRDGEHIEWEDPLTLDFVGRVRAGELPTFDRFICESEFVAINAEVKPNSIRAAANVYLDRLAVRLAEFVDLDGMQLDGRGSAWVIANRTPDGTFEANGNVELKQFLLTNRRGRGLTEPDLKLTWKATGAAPESGPISLTTASLTATAGADQLQLGLLEPVRDVKQLASGKLDAKASGDLARWQKRVSAITTALDNYVMGGHAVASGIVRFSDDTIRVDRLTLSIDNARFVGAGLDITEPNMNAVADLTANLKSGVTTFENFTINAAPLSVTRGKLVVEQHPDGRIIAHGGGPSVTDLNRLGVMVGVYPHKDANGPDALHGTGRGPIQFHYSGDVTTFDGHLDITNFAYGLKTAPELAEPELRLELDGSYTSSTDTVAFKAAKLARPGIALDLAGHMNQFDTTTHTNLAGTLTYDMVKLTPLLRESIGGEFNARGKGTKPVRFVGDLTPRPKPGQPTSPALLATAKAELGLGWDRATAYGFETGPTELRAELTDGVARFAPITATFGGGRVALQPTVRFAPEPQELTLARGQLVDRAKLTPELCAGAMGYVLPPVANAGQVEGTVSMHLDETRVPLANPQQATVKGAIVVHGATLSGGPILTEIAKILGDADGAMTLAKEQTVPVVVERGRVHHRDLTVKIGGYFIKTSGSVSFDGDLDLVVDMPIPGGLPWLRSLPRVEKALRGKRVRVPLTGTLSKPRLDPEQFRIAVMALAREAMKDVGQDVLGKELEKLFPGGAMPKLPKGVLPKLPGGRLPFPFPVPKR